MSNKFTVDKLSEAAYLEGVHGIQCDSIEMDPDRPNRVLFLFTIEEAEGNRILMGFGSSESFRFDNCVKHFKGKLFQKLKGRKNA